MAREIDAGHEYVLAQIPSGHDCCPEDRLYNGEQRLVFVKREGEGYPGNVGHHSGVTTQELCRVGMMRMVYVDKQEHCFENDEVVYHLLMALFYLELRAAKRHGLEEKFLKLLGLPPHSINYPIPEDEVDEPKIAHLVFHEPCIICGHVVCNCEEVK